MPRLRQTKSSGALRPKWHDPPPVPSVAPGFVDINLNHHLPTPSLSPDFLANEFLHQPELRRARSSSALQVPPLPPRPKTPASREQSPFRKALGEAQYFASGLISKPIVSSKHYSILRHSGGITWYNGPSTSVIITVFADKELPPTRKLWLQQRGLSGNVGMTLKAMVGSRSSWVDLTPERCTDVESLDTANERTYQRDIRRVHAKQAHVARETHVLRIPSSCQDGYFRIVLCDGDKVLCNSPIFRLVSISTDMSSLRGASLSTVPLEMGIKAAGTFGQVLVTKYTGVAGAVATKAIGARGAKVGKVAVGAAGDYLQESRRARYERLLGQNMAAAQLVTVGPDAGPLLPFPIAFSGKVALGTGACLTQNGYPTANLHNLPERIAYMSGAYAAWVRIDGDDDDDIWMESTVTLAPAAGTGTRSYAAVHIIPDLYDPCLVGKKLRVVLMDRLRYDDEISGEHATDVATTLASLARPAWSASLAWQRLQAVKASSTLSDRLLEAVESVPLHRVGVRSDTASEKEANIGVGGIYIVR